MTKRLMRVLLSTLALAILLIVGLGFVYMVTVKEDALGVATFHHKTWIPLLVLALGAAGCLYGMDAVRALKKQNPLNLLPAIVLGAALCIATGTPILWVEYRPSSWLIPYAALFALAVLLIEFVYLLRDKEARQMRWDGKAAFKCAGLMLLCCVPAGLCAAADAAMDLPGRVQIALYLLSGAAALWVLRRGNRAAGIALLCIGAVGIAAFFLVLKFFSTGGYENAGFLAARVINGFFSKECLSAYGFCVFGGVKAMMKG